MILATKPNGDPWYVGDIAEVLAAIDDPKTGNPVDPASLEAKVVKPDETEATVAPTKTGTGADFVRVTFTKPGTWQVAIVSPSGEYQGGAVIGFSVKRLISS